MFDLNIPKKNLFINHDSLLYIYYTFYDHINNGIIINYDMKCVLNIYIFKYIYRKYKRKYNTIYVSLVRRKLQ